MIDWKIVMAFLVGLILFIHGVENFSHEVLHFAGERFRKLISRATRNRFLGGMVGMFVTALIQSSTATTVITISLVSAGVISFVQSLGVIMGANVGTTITAQLVAFKVTAYAPIFIIIGFLLSIFRRPYRYIGKGIFYFGLVFFGLNLISEAIIPLKDYPVVIDLFANLTNSYIALLAGLAFTALMHSSSVVTGLVVVLAASGVLTLEQGIPILLGTNIGTTMTALYTSTRLNIFARRAALGHTIFNMAGVLLIWPFITPFSRFVMSLGGSTAQQIANAHTIFNVTAAVLFLFLLTPLRKFVEKAIRSDEEELLITTKYLNAALPESNSRSFSLIEKEISYSLSVAFKFYNKSVDFIREPKGADSNAVEKFEILADLLDEKIEKALLELSRRSLTETEAKKVVLLVRISNLVEQLADTAKNLGFQPISMSLSLLSLSPESLKNIEKIYSKMGPALDAVQREFPRQLSDYTHLFRQLNRVDPIINRGYQEHIKRLKSDLAYAGSSFVESCSILENGADLLKEIMKLSQKYARLKKH
ncbi:Na/Pi cotransporter family protein [Candidatus Peregrinibacteria bacterium]|nr:Na/Pi cotransporter family protein [Candidatus Peregrinibacteria bacterium]